MRIRCQIRYNSGMQSIDIKPRRWLSRVQVELKGDILVWRQRNWSESLSIFIPPECMNLEREVRRDRQALLYAGLALGSGLAIGGIPLFLFGKVLPALGMDAGAALNPLAALLLLLLAAGVAFTVAVYLIRWIRPRPAVEINTFSEYVDEETHEHVREHVFSLQFLHYRGRNPALDSLLRRLRKLVHHAREQRGYTLKRGFTWQQIHPWRAAVAASLRGMLIMVFVLAVLDLAEAWILPAGYEIPAAAGLLLLLPAIWEGFLYLIYRLQLFREPARFQQGMKAYNREDYDAAQHDFEQTLLEKPDHIPSLYQLLGISVLKFDIDRAFRYSEALIREAPELTEILQEDLWVLKRLKERMEMAPDEAGA
jgi:hypothetical protein